MLVEDYYEAVRSRRIRRTCTMHGITNATFWSKQLKEKPCVDRMMILKEALRRKIVKWICVVQDNMRGQLLQRQYTIGFHKKQEFY